VDCAQHAAGEIRTAMRKIFVMTEKLWNLLLHLQALIATYPQAGKSSPVVASILEKNVAEQPRELLFVRLQITVRTARGVNCPYEQVLCSRLASGLGVYVNVCFLRRTAGARALLWHADYSGEYTNTLCPGTPAGSRRSVYWNGRGPLPREKASRPVVTALTTNHASPHPRGHRVVLVVVFAPAGKSKESRHLFL
jgi:hypothetical protein